MHQCIEVGTVVEEKQALQTLPEAQAGCQYDESDVQGTLVQQLDHGRTSGRCHFQVGFVQRSHVSGQCRHALAVVDDIVGPVEPLPA